MTYYLKYNTGLTTFCFSRPDIYENNQRSKHTSSWIQNNIWL